MEVIYKLVKMTGKVIVSDDLVPYDVLLVEGLFKYNLISIGQLVRTSDIAEIFTSDGCLFQPHSSKYIIDIGRKYNGLYFFNINCLKNIKKPEVYSNKTSCNAAVIELVVDAQVLAARTTTSTKNKCVVEPTLELIHARLGHVFLSKMQHIEICNCKELKEYNFSVCIHSKHEKLPFSVNISKATCISAY